MALSIVRRIRDNLHGSVDISELEDLVLEHPIIQRLRRIKQTAFLSLVFPGATHTRFEHSLGVLKLSGVAWEKMRVNQQRIAKSSLEIADFARKELKPSDALSHGYLTPTFDLIRSNVFRSNYIEQALRLAGLMHDIGHAPFSHSGERFLPDWLSFRDSVGKDAIPQYLLDFVDRKIDSLRQKGDDPSKKRVRHEAYTVFFIHKILDDIYSKSGPKPNTLIDPRDVNSIIMPDIDPDDQSPLKKHSLHVLCHELVSGEIDVDRMDYLLRDSKEAGVVYGIFDQYRILDSLAFYYSPDTNDFHVAISFSGLAAFEDYLRARFSMYVQLYFHKTSVAAEAMLQHLASMLGTAMLPAELDSFAEIDEYNIQSHLIDIAKKSLPEKEFLEFRTLLGDVLLSRRLWKREFEFTSQRGADIPRDKIYSATQKLIEKKCRFETVSSKNSLTRFLPRGKNERSKNYLRLIKRDDEKVPRVVPIEDFSSIIGHPNRIEITRHYAEPMES